MYAVWGQLVLKYQANVWIGTIAPLCSCNTLLHWTMKSWTEMLWCIDPSSREPNLMGCALTWRTPPKAWCWGNRYEEDGMWSASWRWKWPWHLQFHLPWKVMLTDHPTRCFKKYSLMVFFDKVFRLSPSNCPVFESQRLSFEIIPYQGSGRTVSLTYIFNQIFTWDN